MKECNGIYTVKQDDKKHGKPVWVCKATGAEILWWDRSCGWEMYHQNFYMCKYWTDETDEDTYPWNLGSSKWIVRPGNYNIEPPPTVTGKVCIGSEIEQRALKDFLMNVLRLPNQIASLPWLHAQIILK